jgi:hypothetical protein
LAYAFFHFQDVNHPPPSSIDTLRNSCVAVRHVLQPFTAIADP